LRPHCRLVKDQQHPRRRVDLHGTDAGSWAGGTGRGVTVFITENREQVIARRRESAATAGWITRVFGLIVAGASYALLTFVLST